MRWKGVIFLVVVIAIVLALSLIFTDRWLESQMESVGSSVNGAVVEFEGVDFSLLNLRISWQRLQVTDPEKTMQNRLETGNCAFDLALEPLLSKKFIIEDFTAEGIRFNTKRETDGKLPQKKQAERETPEIVKSIQKHLENETSRMPVFQISQLTQKINVDSIYAMVDLKTPAKVDSVQNVAVQKYQQWEQRIDDLPDEKELRALENKIKSLDPQKIKNVTQLQSALTTAKEVREQINSYQKEAKSLKTDFQQEVKQIQSLGKNVPQWIEADYQRALSLAKLPDISVKNVAKILFGQKIINQIETVTGYVGTARYYAQKYKESKPGSESPPRLQGQVIHFGKKVELPKFWVKKIDLSAEAANNLQLSGNMANIVSNQKAIGQPTTLQLGGTRNDQASIRVGAIFDYLSDVSRESINIDFDRIPLSNVKLTDFALLPSKIDKGKGFINAQLNFEGNKFEADIQFTGEQIRFEELKDTGKLNPRLLRISRSLIEAINVIRFQAKAKIQEGQLDFRINSNLDNLIAEQAKKIISGEVQQARQELERRVRQETEKYKKQLEQFIQQQQKKLTAEVVQVEKELQKYEKQIEQVRKDIEKRIQEAGKDKLKDLLDRF